MASQQPTENDRSRVRVPKAAELVAADIRRQIVHGDLGEDDALPPEAILMSSYGISRPTLREAFRILESEALVSVRRGAQGGAKVHVPTEETAARYAGLVLQHRGTTLDQVFEARVIVESPVPAILARRRDRASLANQLEASAETLPPIAGHFGEFNHQLVSFTGNETLVLLTRMLESICEEAALAYVRSGARKDDSDEQRAYRARRKLVRLIREGEADAAEDLWRRHLTAAGKVILQGAGNTIVDAVG